MTISLTQSKNGTWVDEEITSLNLPPNLETGEVKVTSLVAGQAMAFVGANGAGKSRMAAWMDRHNENTLYIRARRDVLMPNAYSITPEDAEFNSVLAGRKINFASSQEAKSFRHNSNGDKFGDNDFTHVINMLGSRHATSALKFTQNYDPKSPPSKSPKSDLDVATEIWSDVLPHIVIDSSTAPELKVRRKSEPDEWYEPSQMSDGEKAIFYLVSKCLIAPFGSIIIVDEPEMFVHRSIRTRLWNNIEKSRPDCRFLYFTHDLSFIRTRNYKAVFTVRTYATKPVEYWDYAEFESTLEENETLQISVWGSRQPTLLVEGTTSSLDLKLLSLAYPEFAIEPAGSCDQIIAAVAALKSQKKFHHQEIFGLIDPDFRDEAEIRSLRSKGVQSLKYREIENVVVSDGVMNQFLRGFGMTNADVTDVKDKFITPLRQRFAARADERAADFAKRDVLNIVEEALVATKELTGATILASPADIDAAVSKHRARLSSVCADGSWDDLLRYFSVRKDDFGGVVARAINLKDYASYQEAILRILNSNNEAANEMRRVVTISLPKISSKW